MEFIGYINKKFNEKSYTYGYGYSATITWKYFMQLVDEQGNSLQNPEGIDLKFMVEIDQNTPERLLAKVGDKVLVTSRVKKESDWRSVTLKQSFNILEEKKGETIKGKITNIGYTKKYGNIKKKFYQIQTLQGIEYNGMVIITNNNDSMYDAWCNDLIVEIHNVIIGNDNWLNQILDINIILLDSPLKINPEEVEINKSSI